MAEPVSARARHLGYEPRDVSVRWVAITALAGVLFVVLSAAALYGLPRLFGVAGVAQIEPPPSALEREHPAPPPPHLQAQPAQDLAAYRVHEKSILESYGWVDRDAGVVRIPIERAMQLLAERGWPEPATGPRPPPDATRGLEPWPDWNAARAPSPVMKGDLAPARHEVGR